MLILVTSFRKVLSVLLLIVFPVVAFSQTEPKLFIQQDSAYKFYYPASWKTIKTFEADLHLRIPKTEGQVRCEFKSKTQNITGNFINASIREIAVEEERLTRIELPKLMTPAATVNILKSSFEKINGKEWWIFEFVTNAVSFKFYTRVWKTVHNNKAYSLEYSASDNNFSNNFDQAQAIVNSYNFISKDETVYRKIAVADNTTASTGSQKIITSSGTISSNEKDQGPVAQPGKIITSIPSSLPAVDSAVVVPVGSTEQTEEELIAEEKKKETDLIKNCAAAFVKRKSNELLEIKLGNGKTILLKNKDAGEDTENYRFLDCFPSFNGYLIEVGGWETMSWLLVNKTDGTKTWLASEPVLSPDKKRLICTLSGENEAGYEANYLSIWIFVNGKPKKEFELSNMTWGAGTVEWLSNTSVKVAAEKYDGTETKQLKAKTITLLNGKWVVK